jgi:hypothetical protein
MKFDPRAAANANTSVRRARLADSLTNPDMAAFQFDPLLSALWTGSRLPSRSNSVNATTNRTKMVIMLQTKPPSLPPDTRADSGLAQPAVAGIP